MPAAEPAALAAFVPSDSFRSRQVSLDFADTRRQPGKVTGHNLNVANLALLLSSLTPHCLT
jgi:hypothetical protein